VLPYHFEPALIEPQGFLFSATLAHHEKDAAWAAQ
jgi:hypothetical protein